MDIIPSSCPVGLLSHSHASLPLVCAPISCARIRSSRICSSKRIGFSSRSSESQTLGIGFLTIATPRRNFDGDSWRLVAAASSGKNGKKASSSKGGGKARPNLENKNDDRKKSNSGPASDQSNNKPVPEKKRAKPSVWSAEFSSGNSVLEEQQTESSKERGGSRTGTRVNVIEGGRDVRREYSSTATSNLPTSERRNKQQQQLDDGDNVMFLRYLSPLLPIEEETLLQPEELAPNPVFATFCSNASGVWRGVRATFSPITGDFEPVYLDEDKEVVYDVRVLSTVETLRTSEDGALLPPGQQSLRRKVLWSLEDFGAENGASVMTAQGDEDDSLSSEDDVYGEEVDELGYWEDDEDTEDDVENSDWESVLADPEEIDERWDEGEKVEGFLEDIEDTGSVAEDGTEWKSMWDRGEVLDGDWEGGALPADENESSLTTDQTTSLAQSSTPTSVVPSDDEGLTDDKTGTGVIEEEDLMTLEPGLAFFEDGAYSRGPLELLTDTVSSSHEYFNAHTCKIEQCLVAGGHKRLRVVHTVSIEEGEKIEVLHLAVYEEEWMGPCNMKSISDVGGHQLKLFSERVRHTPEDIVGKWKVFEMEATAIHAGKGSKEKGSFVHACKETSIKRGFPAMPKLTIDDDESVDLSDFSMSWLTGSVSTYVSVGTGGALTFGIGWICDDGTRLVLERAYGEDGKLLHIKSKSEIRVLR